jgi:hypothetical protein
MASARNTATETEDGRFVEVGRIPVADFFTTYIKYRYPVSSDSPFLVMLLGNHNRFLFFKGNMSIVSLCFVAW